MPSGTYTLALRAANGVGSSTASNAVTISIPSACSGAPLTPTNFVVVKTGSALRLFWDPAESGPAPTGFVINVTGAFNGAVPLSARTISATVGAGTYNLSVQATNACGVERPDDRADGDGAIGGQQLNPWRSEQAWLPGR